MRLAPLALLTALALAACGGPSNQPDAGLDGPAADAATDAATDAPDAPIGIPVFRNPITLADLPLAQQAAALLGEGGSKNCNGCHPLTRARLRTWDDLTDAGEAACLTDLQPATQAAALAIVQCLRAQGDLQWHPQRVGIAATAASLPWFTYVFHLAYGASWEVQFDEWRGRVEMPRGDRPVFTQAQFDLVAEWFARDLPQLDAVIPLDPPPPTCTTEIQPAVATHVTAMRTAGWRQLNHDDNVLMYGCAGATRPRDCLAAKPLSTTQTWGQGWTAATPGTHIRLLREITYASSYWTRSSADGRFVSHGGSNGSGGGSSTVIDLVQDREINANAYYDPGFFPDNSGFIIQGGGAHFCKQSLLTSSPTSISFTEPECTTVGGVGLYQHLGAVRGGDYWTVHGQFVSDGGWGSDPQADFSSGSQAALIPMIHDGQRYVARPEIDVTTPSEGDTVISPSSKLLISRVGDGNGGMSGFSMRQLIATPSGDTYAVQVPIAARYCVRGGKPAFSFDERWLVYHHYVAAGDWASLGYASASAPGFQALLTQGAANLFVLDLLTGEERRITTMGPGQLALFPHFRSDGWIYAIVKDHNRGREVIIASDAALIYEEP